MSVLKHMKVFVCYLFTCCGTNAFRMARSSSSLFAKICSCAYIEFLTVIFSWPMDSTITKPDQPAKSPVLKCVQLIILYIVKILGILYHTLAEICGDYVICFRLVNAPADCKYRLWAAS
jgi:hypothetical protein